jgi:protein-S-isoprenylcysteine O-methyltransferase Ste14
LFYIALAYLLGWFVHIPLRVPALLENIGFAFVIIGFLLGLAAFNEFRRARTTLDPHGSTSQLVTGGIYRITRNPIYLGFLLMIIGLPLDSGSYWGVVMAPLYVVTLNRLVIEREEAYLEKKFKDAYTSYASRVRRWL